MDCLIDVKVIFESTVHGKDFCNGECELKLYENRLNTFEKQDANVDINYHGTFRPLIPIRNLSVEVQLLENGTLKLEPRFNFFCPLSMLLKTMGFSMSMQRITSDVYEGHYFVGFPPDNGTIRATFNRFTQ